MTQIPGSIPATASAERGPIAAIRAAARGIPGGFDALVRTAALESNLDAGARAATSSAAGPFQFTQGTWLDMIQRHGADHGLAEQADKLTRGALNGSEREALLNLRHDWRLSAAMANALREDNRAVLETRAGGRIGDIELHLAHFLGAGAAADFVTAHRSDPARSAAEMFPAAAEANRPVFYDQGRARSLDEVRDYFASRLERVDVAGIAEDHATPPSRNASPTASSAQPGADAPAAPRTPRPSGAIGGDFGWMRRTAGALLSVEAKMALAELPLPGAAAGPDERFD